MACIAPERWESTRGVGSGPHRTAVIADRGDRAFVVMVGFSAPPREGSRFVFQGLTWEITRRRTAARGWVARPLRSRRCHA
jgi:hypothetical protein